MKIPTDKLCSGMLIHISCTNFACVWKIISIETDKENEIWLNVIATESNKKKRYKAKYATYIRADQP